MKGLIIWSIPNHSFSNMMNIKNWNHKFLADLFFVKKIYFFSNQFLRQVWWMCELINHQIMIFVKIEGWIVKKIFIIHLSNRSSKSGRSIWFKMGIFMGYWESERRMGTPRQRNILCGTKGIIWWILWWSSRPLVSLASLSLAASLSFSGFSIEKWHADFVEEKPVK